MNLEYHVNRWRKSWSISIWGRRMTFGFGLNVVTDRVITNAPKAQELLDNRRRRYKYSPLEDPNNIRVLELAPGAPKDPLRAQIIHVARSKDHGMPGWSVPYDALSYVWGGGWGSSDMSEIILGDECAIEILPNLDIALRHLRSYEVPRILWIDAVCINQEDNEEKSTQVNQMLDVYAQAETVQIWLGNASSDSTMGMKVLRYLAESDLSEPAPWDQMLEVDFLPAVNGILQRTWFQRMWVIQEACVSRKAIMMCGDDSFQWENDPREILKFMRRIKYTAISPQWQAAGLAEVDMDSLIQLLYLQIQHIERQRKETFQQARDILDVAYTTRYRMASDPRDKLFAIMGMVEQSDQSFFRPDYTMSVEHVFKSFLESIEI